MIGRGSFGEVYRAFDRETGEECAIKEFSKSFLRRKAQGEATRRASAEGGSRRRCSKAVERALSLDEMGPANVQLLRTFPAFSSLRI